MSCHATGATSQQDPAWAYIGTERDAPPRLRDQTSERGTEGHPRCAWQIGVASKKFLGWLVASEVE